MSPFPIEQGIGVIGDLSGERLNDQDRINLKHPCLAGVILFSRNYQSVEQLRLLVAQIREVRTELPIFVDQEGGRVQRFRAGFSRLPPVMKLSERLQQSPQTALADAQALGFLMAGELLLAGVDVSFAPVLDIERGVSKVIGDRSFGTDAAQVSLLAGAFVRGMKAAGMPAVGKHFPGHGAVEADSHLDLPVDDRSLVQINYDTRPFRALIEKQQLAGIMPAHVIYPALDSVRTAGFSSRWTQYLRRSLGFSGVLFSDDLSMQGAGEFGDYATRADLAIGAGCNALVVCNSPDGLRAILDRVARHQENGRDTLDLSAWAVSQQTGWNWTESQLDDAREHLRAVGLVTQIQEMTQSDD